MIVSMTGYGRASSSDGKVKITAEIRGLNSKYLEISLRMPQIFSHREQELKELISGQLTRGKVSITVSLDFNGENFSTLKVNNDAVKNYAKLIRLVMKEAGIREKLKTEHVLKFTDLFKTDDTKSSDKYWNKTMTTALKAFKDFENMKKREGKIIEKDILKRLGYIYSRLKKIETISRKNITDTKSKMTAKVMKLFEDTMISVDLNRIEYELVMIADRLDVTEEVTRTISHLDYFKNSLKEKEPSGRKLNFLIQEINREINTIASKSSNSDISQLVVEMKEELEKIKEQLQNVE